MSLDSRSNSDQVSAAPVPIEAEDGSWERRVRVCRCGLRPLGGTPSLMTLSPPAGASYKSLGCDLIAELRALCPLSLWTSASSSALTPSLGQGRWISLYFMPGISCPVDRWFPGELGQQSPAEEPPQGRQGARWAGTRALISLPLETRCALSQILSSCLLCARSLWPQLAPEGRCCPDPPAGCPTPALHAP